MQQVGKHCWCSPKSGIILAESTWQNVHVADSDYKFLQMRDPFNRVVSMYLNKIVDIDVRHLADVKRENWVPWIDVPDPYDDINSRAEVYKNYLTSQGQGCYRLPLDPNSNPGVTAESLTSDLLLRVFQKSESGRLKRVNGDQSLLLIQLPMELMQERIPIIKAQWIKTGDNEKLLAELQTICNGIWSAVFNREDGLNFSKVA